MEEFQVRLKTALLSISGMCLIRKSIASVREAYTPRIRAVHGGEQEVRLAETTQIPCSLDPWLVIEYWSVLYNDDDLPAFYLYEPGYDMCDWETTDTSSNHIIFSRIIRTLEYNAGIFSRWMCLIC
jgi:hypothetical protein